MAGVTVPTIRYRVLRGTLPPPDDAGQWDEAIAREAFRKHPVDRRVQASRIGKTKVGRMADVRRAKARVQDEPRATRTPHPTAMTLMDPYTDDPEMSFRWAKAEQEKIKLAKMQGEVIELALIERRAFGFFRLIRKRMDDWVSRASPAIAAKVQADEGAHWRALTTEMRAFQLELSGLDLRRALTEEISEVAVEDVDVGDDSMPAPSA